MKVIIKGPRGGLKSYEDFEILFDSLKDTEEFSKDIQALIKYYKEEKTVPKLSYKITKK